MATEALNSDHRNIGRMLTVLQRAGNRLAAGEEAPLELFRDATDFFLTFSDTCHYGKEEAAFLPVLEQAGIPKGACPISLILNEHEQARQLNRTLAVTADRLIQGERRVRRTLVLIVRDYVNLVRPHIIREDNIVFPLADVVLPTAAHKRLLADFEAIEAAKLGSVANGRFEVTLDKMEKIVAAWPLPWELPVATPSSYVLYG